MKFLIKLTLLSTFFINMLVNSQHLKVEYERYDLNEDYDLNRSKEFNDKKNQVHKIPMKLFLYYADGFSFFKSIPRNSFTNNAGDIQKDETTTLHKRETYKETELKIYHNKNENGNYSYHNFPQIKEEFYGYIEPKFAKIEYKEDIINIDNYICKLVEVSLESDPTYINKIWYTEAIPIAAGPFSFSVFPGLVLRVETPSYILTAIKISNNVEDSEVEKMNPKLKVYRNNEFIKKMQEVVEQSSKPTFEEIKL
jgi:GLPGLI family protein